MSTQGADPSEAIESALRDYEMGINLADESGEFDEDEAESSRDLLNDARVALGAMRDAIAKLTVERDEMRSRIAELETERAKLWESAEMVRVRTAGRKLALAAYSLHQRGVNYPLTRADLNSMEASWREWDEALDALSDFLKLKELAP